MIDELDRWEAKYIYNLPGYQNLAWSDKEAFYRYPKWNHIYDKLVLSKFTGVTTFDLELEFPSMFPVVVKPRRNFEGLSKNCYIASSADEVEDFAGYIAQELLDGYQCTTDYVLREGVIIDQFSFVTHKNNYGEIKCFSSTPFSPNDVSAKIRVMFQGYTGVLNVESINGRIIEIHLRPSLQFYDVCGGLIEQLPTFYDKGIWDKVNFEQTYSRVFRTRHDGKVREVKMPNGMPSEVRSVQLCYEEGVPLSSTDPSLFRKRYLVINGTDLTKIEDFAKTIRVRLK